MECVFLVERVVSAYVIIQGPRLCPTQIIIGRLDFPGNGISFRSQLADIACIVVGFIVS